MGTGSGCAAVHFLNIFIPDCLLRMEGSVKKLTLSMTVMSKSPFSRDIFD